MGSDQQFCLRWHNYQSSLLASLPQLLDGDDLTDVTLSAAGRNLRAHRVVLSACSQYFKELFKALQPLQHPVIVLPGANFTDLCALVTFMYSGEVNIYQEQLSGLLNLADAMQIRGLAEVNGVRAYAKDSLHQSSPILGLPSSIENSASGGTRVKIEREHNSEGTGNSRISPDLAAVLKRAAGIEDMELGSAENSAVHGNQEMCIMTCNAMCKSAVACSLVVIAACVMFTAQQSPSSEDSGGGNFGPDAATMAAANRIHLSPGPHFSNFKLSSSCPSTPHTASTSTGKLFATCLVCGKQLSNQYNLRVHMETHQNVNYACGVCSHISRSRDALRKHVAYRHPGEGREKAT
ncbi:Protein bric-a-brac 2, partial [Zootermopsis nevadensis]